MVHYGKHIIDPKTGLCEICDRGAIHDFRHGKRPGRQFLYSNQDGRFTYRPNDDETRHNYDETTPRRTRKPHHSEPPPARIRPIVHEEPVIVQKKVPRRNYSPLDDIQYSSSNRPTTFYYVDNTGQMIPTNEGPPDDPRRRYLVQNHQSPPITRPARAVQRRAQTPPPIARPARAVQRRAQTPPPTIRPARAAQRRDHTPPSQVSESWRSRPKRQNNVDTELIQQPNRAPPNDHYFNNQSPRAAEMYYIEKPYNENRYRTINSLVQAPHDNNSSPSKIVHQGDTNRKQRQLEPVERQYYTEPEPTVIKKVYKKLPTTRSEYPQDEYIPNGNNLLLSRKVEKIYPSPRTYKSSPQLTNRHIRSPLLDKNPSVYYIRSADEYQ